MDVSARTARLGSLPQTRILTASHDMAYPGNDTPMPRTRRYIFNTLTAVSLLLTLVVAGPFSPLVI